MHVFYLQEKTAKLSKGPHYYSSLGWPGTGYIDCAGYEGDLPAYVFQVLGLKVCATTCS